MSVIPIDTARSPLAYALRYAAIGAHVFPCWWIAEDGKCACRTACKSPGKHPIPMLTPKGQHDATVDPTVLRRWWQQMPKANVAIFLAPTRWVAVDIDPRSGGLETIERIEAQHGPLESDVLAYTGGGGEHRVFLAPAEVGSLPGKLGRGVDLKHNGYIVVEPSNHKSGKQYAWEASSDPLEGAIPSPLPDWLRNLSAAPVEASVPATVRPVSAAEFADMLAALPSIPSDDRDTWLQVGMACHSTGYGQQAFDAWDAWSRTSTKYDPVDQTRTWRSFRFRGIAGVTKATIFALAQRHGWTNAPSLPAPVPVEALTVVEPKAPEAPSFNAPGILSDVMAWSLACARKPNPQYAMAAAITFASAVLGRRYVTDQHNWPSLFLLVVGQSGSGKEHAKWTVETLLDACQLGHLVGPASYTSDSGLLSALLRQPSHVTVIDEFGKVLEAASIKGAARAQSTMRALMEVWGRCDGVMRPQGFSTFGMGQRDADDLAAKTVRNPALALLGLTTPDSFYDSIGSAAARDGFLNRFLIIEDTIGRQLGQSRKGRPDATAISQWATAIRDTKALATGASMEATPTIIPIDAAADRAFVAFEADCLAKMDELEAQGMAELWGRTCEIAMRLALVASQCEAAQVVTSAHAAWAIDLARHYAQVAADRFHASVADSDFEAACQQVYAAIVRAGKEGRTERELADRCRRYRAMRPRERVEVLASLSQLGQVAQTNREQLFPARKTAVWVAITDNADNSQT